MESSSAGTLGVAIRVRKVTDAATFSATTASSSSPPLWTRSSSSTDNTQNRVRGAAELKALGFSAKKPKKSIKEIIYSNLCLSVGAASFFFFLAVPVRSIKTLTEKVCRWLIISMASSQAESSLAKSLIE